MSRNQFMGEASGVWVCLWLLIWVDMGMESCNDWTLTWLVKLKSNTGTFIGVCTHAHDKFGDWNAILSGKRRSAVAWVTVSHCRPSFNIARPNEKRKFILLFLWENRVWLRGKEVVRQSFKITQSIPNIVSATRRDQGWCPLQRGCANVIVWSTSYSENMRQKSQKFRKMTFPVRSQAIWGWSNGLWGNLTKDRLTISS